MPNENAAHVEMYKAYLEDLGRIVKLVEQIARLVLLRNG
jgi:hypothetical protein